MYENVQFGDFQDAFRRMDRQDQFSYEGKKALFEYLEGLEEDMGEEIELDVIALCCDFTEFASLEEYNKEYELVESIEDIEQQTQVIRINDAKDGPFIIQNF